MSAQLETEAPYVLDPGAGEKLAWFTSEITRKASDPLLGVTEAVITRGEEPPMHVHSRESEWFYLLEGEVTFYVGGEEFQGVAGSFVSFPNGIPHTFAVDTESARFLVLNTPGGFERMFDLGPKTPDEAVAALNQYGMEVVGPNPRHA